MELRGNEFWDRYEPYQHEVTANTILPGQICSWTDGQCEIVHPGLSHADYENQYTL